MRETETQQRSPAKLYQEDVMVHGLYLNPDVTGRSLFRL